MYFWLSLLALAVLGNGHRMAQRWQRSHRSSTVALHGFGSVQVRDIFRLEAYETSVDPEKLKFTFSYDNYTDWGGNSRCSGYLYLFLFRPGGAKPFAIEFDGDRRLVAEMAESLVVNDARLEQHFRNIPMHHEPKPALETLTRFRISSGMYGYRNNEGKEVLAPQYSMAAEFRDGLALVIWGGEFGRGLGARGRIARKRRPPRFREPRRIEKALQRRTPIHAHQSKFLRRPKPTISTRRPSPSMARRSSSLLPTSTASVRPPGAWSTTSEPTASAKRLLPWPGK